MRTIILAGILFLSGCTLFDYPGGPKDIARYNQQVQAKMESLRQQTEAAQKREAARKAERDEWERQAAENNRARAALMKEQIKAREEERRKASEDFVAATSASLEAEQRQKEAARKNARAYVGDMERYIKAQLKPTKVNARCGFYTDDAEVQCVLVSSASSSHSPQELHSLQRTAYDLAIRLQGVYPVDYSIFAQTADDIPLARFIYNHQMDILTPMVMWY